MSKYKENNHDSLNDFILDETADDVEKSLIRTQVEMGVAARMACLEALIARSQ